MAPKILGTPLAIPLRSARVLENVGVGLVLGQTIAMSHQAPTDHLTALALAARDGDERALGQFIAVAQADVWRLCAYLANRSEADDLAQETFERAIGSLHRFRGESGARPWLLSICRRVCVDSTRRNIRLRRINEAVQSLADLGSRTSSLGSTIELDLAVEALSSDRYEAFVLTQLIGLPYAEAASVLDVPVGTIRSRVARARLDLVTALAITDQGTTQAGATAVDSMGPRATKRQNEQDKAI